MLTINTSPGCRSARWGWQLNYKIWPSDLWWERSGHDTFQRRCSTGREGATQEEVLPGLMGLFERPNEDEETSFVCVRWIQASVEGRHDAR